MSATVGPQAAKKSRREIIQQTDVHPWHIDEFARDRELWIAAVWADDQLDPLSRLVATAVAFRLNKDTLEAFPSQVRLAAELRAEPRTVRRGIARLILRGWLTTWRPSQKANNRYQLSCSLRVLAGVEMYRLKTADLVDEARDRKRAKATANGLRGPHCPP